MNFLKEPIKIGSLVLVNRVFYAPLAGCSDYPFRRMSAKYKPGLMYCEMVKMDALIRNDPGTLRMLDYSIEMHPIAAQLCGSKPMVAAKAAKIVESLGFDAVDLNCGCPVDKVTKDGSGSAMLKTPELIGEVIASMKAAVNIPVTVKIRAGWDEKNINGPEIVKIAEQGGADAICIHARTREQGYRGPANWDYIKKCKEAADKIIVIGNGDVVDAASATKIVEYTGCDAVLVARATMGRPWIIEEVMNKSVLESTSERSLEECRESLYHHFLMTKQYHHDYRVCLDMRRVGCWYLKKSSGTRQFRELISRAKSIDEVEDLILNFPLGEAIAEGIIEDKSSDECCL